MESNDHVEPASSNNGLISFIFRILGVPFAIGRIIYCYLFKKRLSNCLPGKVVLITGASSGLGEALAHTFYVAGCKVVLAARRQEELERVRKDLIQLHSVSRHCNQTLIMLITHIFSLNSDTHDSSASRPSFGSRRLKFNARENKTRYRHLRTYRYSR